jgi:hypothetical protein
MWYVLFLGFFFWLSLLYNNILKNCLNLSWVFQFTYVNGVVLSTKFDNLKFRNQTSFNHYKHSKYFLGQTIISPTTTYILYFFKIVLSSEPNPHFLFQTDTNLNSHKYSCVNSEILKKTTCISFILGQPPIKS